MNLYLVCYDPDYADSKRGLIEKTLNSYNGVRFRPDAWIILSEDPSGILHGKLSEHLGAKSYLIVTRLSDDISFTQPAVIENWITKNLSL